jgi:hypothetical protein
MIMSEPSGVQDIVYEQPSEDRTIPEYDAIHPVYMPDVPKEKLDRLRPPTMYDLLQIEYEKRKQKARDFVKFHNSVIRK